MFEHLLRLKYWLFLGLQPQPWLERLTCRHIKMDGPWFCYYNNLSNNEETVEGIDCNTRVSCRCCVIEKCMGYQISEVRVESFDCTSNIMSIASLGPFSHILSESNPSCTRLRENGGEVEGENFDWIHPHLHVIDYGQAISMHMPDYEWATFFPRTSPKCYRKSSSFRRQLVAPQGSCIHL